MWNSYSSDIFNYENPETNLLDKALNQESEKNYADYEQELLDSITSDPNDYDEADLWFDMSDMMNKKIAKHTTISEEVEYIPKIRKQNRYNARKKLDRTKEKLNEMFSQN